MANKRFSNVLAEMGLVDRAQVDEALALRKKTGRHLGEILVQLGYLTQDQVADALAAHTGVPRIDLDEVTIEPGIRELVPEELITRHHIVPLGFEGAALKVAMANPFDFVALDSVRAATRLDVIPTLTTVEQIARAHDRQRLKASAQLVVEELGFEEEDEEDPGILDDVGESSRVKVVNMIIVQGIRNRASDIHIEPQENQIRIRYRIDGHLRDVMEFPKRLRNEIVARIKVMAELDITERRRPQDGRLRVSYDGASIEGWLMFPHGYDPEVCRPGQAVDSRFLCDVGVIGTYGANKERVLAELLARAPRHDLRPPAECRGRRRAPSTRCCPARCRSSKGPPDAHRPDAQLQGRSSSQAR
jgi:type IV pilus assembly protein PilB